MRYRKLRIAFSATCLIACVLLIALWVRSYWRVDYCEHFDSGGDGMEFGSIRGVVYLSHTIDIARGTCPRWEWGSLGVDYNIPPSWLFGWSFSPPDYAAPHLLLAVLCSMFAAVPWIRRFSIRTLLIATTLVAVVLGAIVWLR